MGDGGLEIGGLWLVEVEGTKGWGGVFTLSAEAVSLERSMLESDEASSSSPWL